MVKTQQSGMTLIELMVSVLIVAILAAGLFAVGGYLDKQFKIKATEGTMQLLVTAIEQYHDFYKEFPYVNSTLTGSDEYPNNKYDNDGNDIERLYYKLTLAPDAKKILDQINRKYIKSSDDDKNPEVVDAWGENFRYIYEKKINTNFPEIISAGPDKKFGADDPNGAADDISSKKM
jgi:prepilin-type N-terminal cleavage/methylation domain-containing protein